MINIDQITNSCKEIVDAQKEIYLKGASITNHNKIPDSSQIPIRNQNHWIKIPNVICVYVDMVNSTRLSATRHDKSTASTYQLFTGTAVRLFHEFYASYIDVRGDGVFALFDSDKPHIALASAVTFKTFSEEEFVPTLKSKVEVDIGCHVGIDQKTLLVKKIGLQRIKDRTDRQNEVWAGKPVNMASKLASKGTHGELIVSDRFFNAIKCEEALYSCGCPNEEKVYLWESVDLSDDANFDFKEAYLLRSKWCKDHGREYCEKVIEFDQ